MMFGFKINRVTGDSMSPRLAANSYVLLHQFGNKKQLKKGQIVTVAHHNYGAIIKRIAHQDRNGLYWLCGDNPKSLSSCELGPISAEQITGILICQL